MATLSKVVTYEEWLQMPIVENAIEEVVNGEIRIMPPSKWDVHAIVVDNLRGILGAQLDTETIRVIDTVSLSSARIRSPAAFPTWRCFGRRTSSRRKGTSILRLS